MNAGGALGEEEVDVNFYLEDRIHSGWSLLGRATTVIGASRKEKDTNGGTEDRGETVGGNVGNIPSNDSKDTQQTQGGTGAGGDGVEGGNGTSGTDATGHVPSGTTKNPAAAEAWQIHLQARDAYRKAYSETIKKRNLVLKISWPEMSRPAEWMIIGHAQTLGKSDKFIEGHIPVVKFVRDFDRHSTRHIRTFLGLRKEKNLGTRTLRLIVMNRLRPIYDLGGKEFWVAFWQCFACTCSLASPTDIADLSCIPTGHHRLWVNGIHHGDISFNNLMYDFLEKTGNPVGILNDFDLATWVDHSTTNNDRTGTIPFVAIDLLDGGLQGRVPRLYRHDMESFIWVLAYITVARVRYDNSVIGIFLLPGPVDAWFKDGTTSDRNTHVESKLHFHSNYGLKQPVSGRYRDYTNVVKKMILYWDNFHEALLSTKYTADADWPEPVIIQAPATLELGGDDPADSLKEFIGTVGKLLGGGVWEGFEDVKALLLEAVEIPTAVDTIYKVIP